MGPQDRIASKEGYLVALSVEKSMTEEVWTEVCTLAMVTTANSAVVCAHAKRLAVTVVSKCAAAHCVGKEALVFGEPNFRGCWQSADLRRMKVPAVAPLSAPSVPELVRLRTSNQNELALVTRLRLDCGGSQRKTKDAISQPPAFCIGFRNAEQPKMVRRTGP